MKTDYTADAIKALLRKYAILKEDQYYPAAWSYFLKQAQKDKKWAQNITQDWLDNASDMSIEMYHKYLETPIEEMAAYSYGYSHYRGHAVGHAFGHEVWVDPTAHDLWEKFESEK